MQSMKLDPIFRAFAEGDGPPILNILDSCVLWMRARPGGGQWTRLFSEGSDNGASWREKKPSGDLINEGTSQLFVVEVNDWAHPGSGERCVGGYVELSTRNPKYVPPANETQIWMSMAAVHPEVHHQGIGRILVEGTVAIARQRGTSLIRLDCWGGSESTKEEGKTLVEAYERLGFMRSERVYHETLPAWVQVMEFRIQ